MIFRFINCHIFLHEKKHIIFEIEKSEFITAIDSTLFRENYNNDDEYFNTLANYYNLAEEKLADLIITYKEIIRYRENAIDNN